MNCPEKIPSPHNHCDRLGATSPALQSHFSELEVLRLLFQGRFLFENPQQIFTKIYTLQPLCADANRCGRNHSASRPSTDRSATLGSLPTSPKHPQIFSERDAFAMIIAKKIVWAMAFCGGVGVRADAGQPISFPWGECSQKAPAVRTAPHQILPPTAGDSAPQVTIQRLPPKAGYAYGWFGSNSHPQLTRHFGTGQNFTQWKWTP